MLPHSEKRLALSSFCHSFLGPVLSDWHQSSDFGAGERRVIQCRLIEAASWLLVGTDFGFFEEHAAETELRAIPEIVLKSYFDSELAVAFESELLSRIRSFASTGRLPSQQAVSYSGSREETARHWGRVIALAGEFASETSTVAFIAALVFSSKSNWSYLCDVQNCDANWILKSRYATFDPWAGGRAGLVYIGLVRSMQHLERLLELLSTAGSETGERAPHLERIIKKLGGIHTWWFDIANEETRTRFEKLSENFGAIAGSVAPDPVAARDAFADYARNLWERWELGFGRRALKAVG